jgi:hypothetical protein
VVHGHGQATERRQPIDDEIYLFVLVDAEQRPRVGVARPVPRRGDVPVNVLAPFDELSASLVQSVGTNVKASRARVTPGPACGNTSPPNSARKRRATECKGGKPSAASSASHCFVLTRRPACQPASFRCVWVCPLKLNACPMAARVAMSWLDCCDRCGVPTASSPAKCADSRRAGAACGGIGDRPVRMLG